MTVSHRLTRSALPLLLIASLAACNPNKPSAQPIIGGDALIKPNEVNAAALQAGLDPRTQAFYAARGFRPAWSPQAAKQLQAAIADLEQHAIDGKRFTEMLNVQDPTGREIALTKTALAYGDVLAHGLIDPAKVFEIFALDTNKTAVDPGLNTALDQNDLGPWLKTLAPQDAEYAALSKDYVAYLKAAALPQPPAIAEGKPIKPGGRDSRVPQIAQLMSVTPDAADPTAYAGAVVESVKAFQDAQGINNDGVIGADTIAVLNAGPIDRARQIALNLEARRWLKRDLPATRIEVNTAAATLRYYKDGKLADTRRTVAGKPKHETPLLSGAFKQLVVNPPWNVPDSIARKEILPKGPGYLEANDMYVKDGLVIQRPGPKASLGLVKFDMQNRYAIYLHDTPSKGAFGANERHGSHGCVRVQGAVDFARKLAEERGVAADFDAKLAAGETKVVQLGATIPVRLAYHTAFMDDAGQIVFRPDIYGWDKKLATALGLPAPIKRAVAVQAGDVGP